MVYFTVNDGNKGFELWKTDGTSLVKDIFPGSESSVPRFLTNVNGTVYFRASDGNSGFELWKSDGSSAGTMLVADINSGAGNSQLSNLTNVDGTLYFSASDGNSGYELWKSDGTTTGTMMVKDIVVGTGSADPRQLLNVNGTLYFLASDGGAGFALWKSDGTSLGTRLVNEVSPNAFFASRSSLANVNGIVYFQGYDAVSGNELWKTDGTSSGTMRVNDIAPGVASSTPGELTNVNGMLYFVANDGSSGFKLWKSDGTTSGTVLVKDIFLGTGDANPRYLTEVKGTLYFRAADSSRGGELWRSDGSSIGTVLVKDIFPGSSGASPNSLTNVNGRLYFAASDGVSGTELWVSDGTSLGTHRIADLNPGSKNSNPSQMVNLNGTLIFTATNYLGTEVWRVSSSVRAAGNVVSVDGGDEENRVVINFTSPSDYEIMIDGVSQAYSTSMQSSIEVDTGNGNDSLTVTLSSLDDSATLGGSTNWVTGSGYSIVFSNVETTVLNGAANDQMNYQDPGVVLTAYLLPAYGIVKGFGFSYQAIAFGNYTVDAIGDDDNLFIYGDSSVQAYVATPLQSLMPVGSQRLIGNYFKRVYAYGMGGNDTATYSGSAADEIMTALASYTFVTTATTVQYFDSFKTLAVTGGGGLDIAVMYDTAGVDAFFASDMSFRYTRAGVFDNIANGYDRVYAFNYFGGFDTATLNGSSGNDRLTSITNYSVLVTPATLQQATGFRTVIVNAGAGVDTATLQDSPGNDTLNASAGTAELIYANGRIARGIGFDRVSVVGTLGGINRKNISLGNRPTYQLTLYGSWF